MTYSEVEKKKRHSQAVMKSAIKRNAEKMKDYPNACFVPGCIEDRVVKNGVRLTRCKRHLEARAAWQRRKYHAMLEAFQAQVRVTESPTVEEEK